MTEKSRAHFLVKKLVADTITKDEDAELVDLLFENDEEFK